MPHLAEVAKVVLPNKVGRRPPHRLNVQRARQRALLRILRRPLLRVPLLLLLLLCLLGAGSSGWWEAGCVGNQVLVLPELG